MDALYTARYRIVERIAGDPPGAEIDFGVADHYGFPAFASRRYALLYVTIAPDGAWLQKYQGYALRRTLDGDWATCGSPGDHPVSGEPSVVPLRFVEPEMVISRDVTPRGTQEFLERLDLDSADLEVTDGQVWCRRGVRLAELHAWVARGVLASRGFDPRDLGVDPVDNGADQATRP
jgi:hypothetical protein